jgi:hypothetical protein
LAAAVALLAACTRGSPDAAALSGGSGTVWLRPAMPGTACRLPGADGRMQIAERGIGGTGPVTRPPPSPTPGGTPPPTGIAAVITGFGSICLAGLEVQLAPSLAVTIDGATASPRHLAAGERAVLVATWQDDRPATAEVAIRHEIVGPVQSVLRPDHLIVAGQDVHVAPGAWVQAALTPGTWIAVSGLPQPDGGVLASRIDPAAAAAGVLLHGRLRRDGHGFAIGALPVLGGNFDKLAGQRVRLVGRLVDDRLMVALAVPDRLESDPALVFGPRVTHYAIQTLIGGGDGAGPFAVHMALPPGTALPATPEPAILGLVRTGVTGLVATSVSVAGTAPGSVGSALSAQGSGPNSAKDAGFARGPASVHAGGFGPGPSGPSGPGPSGPGGPGPSGPGPSGPGGP